MPGHVRPSTAPGGRLRHIRAHVWRRPVAAQRPLDPPHESYVTTVGPHAAARVGTWVVSFWLLRRRPSVSR